MAEVVVWALGSQKELVLVSESGSVALRPAVLP